MPNILLVSATKLEHHDTEINGVPIHIIGIGKVEAALNTYKLIQKYKPDHVVNFGSCGSLCSARIGDVIEVGEVYDDFYGCVVPEHSSIRVSDTKVKLFTTDTFYDSTATYSNSYVENLRKCDLVDMEGYSIAKVCLSENISVSLFKWISDSGDSTDWRANASIGYNNFKKVFNERFN
jgi:adenosylhomocysteine nucleosidase